MYFFSTQSCACPALETTALDPSGAHQSPQRGRAGMGYAGATKEHKPHSGPLTPAAAKELQFPLFYILHIEFFDKFSLEQRIPQLKHVWNSPLEKPRSPLLTVLTNVWNWTLNRKLQRQSFTTELNIPVFKIPRFYIWFNFHTCKITALGLKE